MSVSSPPRISPEEAAALVRSGDWVDYGVTLGQPDLFDRALAARKAELHGVRIRGNFSMRPRAVIEADPDGEHFAFLGWHFSAYGRRQHDAGLASYIPPEAATSPAPGASSSSCAAPTPHAAASPSCAWLPPTSATAGARAAS